MTLSGDALSLTTGLHDVSRAAGASVHSARAEPRRARPFRRGRRAQGRGVRRPRRRAPLAGRAGLRPLRDRRRLRRARPSRRARGLCPRGRHLRRRPALRDRRGRPVDMVPRSAACAAVALHRAALDSELPFVHVYEATEGAAPPAPLRLRRDRGGPRPGPPARRRPPRSGSPARPQLRRPRPLRDGRRPPRRRRRAGTPSPSSNASRPPTPTRSSSPTARTFPLACSVARAMRASGRKVGVLGVRALRPFFAADVVKAISRAKSAVVIEPLDAPLTPTGPLAACVKGAFFDALTWAPGFPGIGRVPPS
ncbi:MAG: hypothetical protein R3F14_21040 [Polyangiaceae bacterium]